MFFLIISCSLMNQGYKHDRVSATAAAHDLLLMFLYYLDCLGCESKQAMELMGNGSRCMNMHHLWVKAIPPTPQQH